MGGNYAESQGNTEGASQSQMAKLMKQQRVKTILLDAIGLSGAGGHRSETLRNASQRIVMLLEPVCFISHVRFSCKQWYFACGSLLGQATTTVGFTVTVGQVDEATQGKDYLT